MPFRPVSTAGLWFVSPFLVADSSRSSASVLAALIAWRFGWPSVAFFLVGDLKEFSSDTTVVFSGWSLLARRSLVAGAFGVR